jgi:hypothetical protein
MSSMIISTYYDLKCIIFPKKLNKSQKLIKEGSAKVLAQFRIGMVPYFG